MHGLAYYSLVTTNMWLLYLYLFIYLEGISGPNVDVALQPTSTYQITHPPQYNIGSWLVLSLNDSRATYNPPYTQVTGMV